MTLSGEDIQAFLDAYPRMSIQPIKGGQIVFAGRLDFRAAPEGGVEVGDSFELRIEVPSYPENLPRVFEMGGRIPRELDNHVLPDGALCLGSPLRLRLKIGRQLRLLSFANECIVPYLYATSRLPAEGTFIFGELAHGNPGRWSDYRDILGVADDTRLLAALLILSIKPTSADRHPCPCGCGRRLAVCEFRDRMSELRKLAPRKYFVSLYSDLRADVRTSRINSEPKS